MDGATWGGTAEPTSREQSQGKSGDRERGKIEKVTERKKILARKRRRRDRAERRRLRQSKRRNRARARGREIGVATHNVRTMAVDGTHVVGRALDVSSVYDRLGCDVIGLRETRRSGHSAFSQAGYLVYCSGECGGENGRKKGQGGVGLAVRTSITRAARPPEFSLVKRLPLNYGVEPRPLRLLWDRPRLKHRMLVITCILDEPRQSYGGDT